MIKDYAKYTTYRRGRSRQFRLRTRLGLLISLLILGVGLFFLKFHSRQQTNNSQQIAQQTANKLKQQILEAPAPKPPEPKFDFYNILPKDSLPSPTQPTNQLVLPSTPQADTVLTHDTTSASLQLKKPLTRAAAGGTSPEQAVMAETKQQLDREINQLSNDNYMLVLGNFQKISQSEQYQAQALLKGFPVRSRVNRIHGAVVYQLFMGPYPGLALASQQQKRLSAAGMESILAKLVL